MGKRFIIKARDVVGFSFPGNEDVFESCLLIDNEITGSEKLSVKHFTFKPGKSIPSGKHPCPYDEVYYVLRGKAILNLDGQETEIGPDTAIFIPCETCKKNYKYQDF